MSNRKTTFASPIKANFKLAGVAAAMMLASADVSALGLGALEVQSNLDQPLNGFIELRVNSGDDVDSVTASIAPRADFANLGIDYPSYLKDITLSIEDLGDGRALRVVSNGIIIKEPFIHFLVRVDWTGGSFLREYTALIDPPVYAAEAPKALAEPKSVGTDQSYESDSFDDYDVESIDDSTPVEDVVEQEIADPEPLVDELVEDDEPFADVEPLEAEPLEESNLDDDYYQPDAVGEVEEGDADSDPVSSKGAEYGPVVSGESLSVIAAELQRQLPDLSIYQIMQVMFEQNQSAFINGNINGLIQGAVLNIDDLDSIRAVDVEDSKVFYRDQLAEWDPSVLSPNNDDSLKVGQDEYSYNDDTYTDNTDYGSASSASNDSFQIGSSSDTESFVSNSDGNTSDGEVIALRNQITDLQATVASSTLENQELTERISILEGQLTDLNRLVELGVEDAELASVEATLAEQNNSDIEAVDEYGDMAEYTGDDTYAEDSVVEDEVSDFGFDESSTNDGVLVSGDGITDESSLDEGLDGADLVDSLLGGESENTDTLSNDVVNTAESVVEPIEKVESKPVPAPIVKEQGLMASVKSAVVDNGLWKILAGIGALLIGALVALFLRRRRADEEFEISMLSIESNSQSINTSTASASMSTSMTHSSMHSQIDDGEDKETSFLTVYSDSDAVVQADEVDPIAEADVYIAYGRDEQAEEVLLDGIASHPERLDIKHKLLGLYHKTKNTEGFERAAEEIYSQGEELTPEIWADVCKMGKELSSENPLFELSTDDLAAVDMKVDSTADADIDSVDLAGSAELSAAAKLTDLPDVASSAFAEADTSGLESDDVASIDLDLNSSSPEESSDLIVDALDSDGDSIQLMDFDDGRSEISELDEIELDSLDITEDGDDDLDFVVSPEDGSVSDIPEVDLNEVSLDEVETEPSIELEDDDEAEYSERSFSEVQEVSDLEIDPDYDEARTQYELAKVFVDLGDEDGARKILTDLVANTENSKEVIDDSQALLDSISG